MTSTANIHVLVKFSEAFSGFLSFLANCSYPQTTTTHALRRWLLPRGWPLFSWFQLRIGWKHAHTHKGGAEARHPCRGGGVP